MLVPVCHLNAATGSAVSSRAAAASARAVSGLDGLADPAGLPWLALVLMALGLAAAPIANAYSRRIEAEADDFALALTQNVPAFRGALDRLAALNLSKRRPSRLEELLLYTHPSVDRRIARQLAAPGLPLRP